MRHAFVALLLVSACHSKTKDAQTTRSPLHVAAHQVPRAHFAAIDFHQHVDDAFNAKGQLPVPPEQLLKVMDAANVRTVVILSGPKEPAEFGHLFDAIVGPHPDRFVLFTQVDWSANDRPDFGEWAAARLREVVARGARGLKVRKELGLAARDKQGRLLAVDDPRFDPIWAECGKLGIPVAIHTGDPEAFFDPVDSQNERLIELQNSPNWSYHGKDFPSLAALLEARDRVVARHPDTTFVGLHAGGWPENLDYVSEALRRYPNLYVDLGGRQAELGRQPRRAGRFFLEFPDRILFGSDFGVEPDVYAGFFRWLETDDEYFPPYGYPNQGRFYIYGVGLPDDVLEKVYHLNAEHILTPQRLLQDAQERRQRP
jgi:predicted TIM-barrel fold metal-dependent hydrolase